MDQPYQSSDSQSQTPNNALPPVKLSADPPWIGAPSVNWGISEGPALVCLDPQINVRCDEVTAPSGRRDAAKSMSELTREFAETHDELLRELAR